MEPTPFTAPPSFYKLYKNDPGSLLPPPPPPPKVPSTFSMKEAMLLGKENEDCGKGDVVLDTSEDFYQLCPPEEDPGTALRKLNHSLLFNYLQLLDVLASRISETPAQANKIDDIKTIMFNMNDLVVSLRPFLAKEAIIKKLETQLNRKLRLIEELEEAVRVNSEKLDTVYKGADMIVSGSEEAVANSERLLQAGSSTEMGMEAETGAGESVGITSSSSSVLGSVDGDGDVEIEAANESNSDDIQTLLDTVTGAAATQK